MSETERTEDEEFPNKISQYWGILTVKAANKKIEEDCPEDGFHLQRLACDVTVALHGYRTSVHISTGALLFP